MAKRRRRKNDRSLNPFRDMRQETMRGTVAVLFFAISVFLLLAAFSSAGIVGNSLYRALAVFLGIGYFLIPLLLLVLAFTFLRDTEGKSIGAAKAIASVFFFLAGLGLIETLVNGKGGVVGNLISSSLVALVEVYAAILALSAVLVISLLIIFDGTLRFAIPSFTTRFLSIFGRRKTEEKSYGTHTFDEEGEKGYEEEEEEEEEEKKEKDSPTTTIFDAQHAASESDEHGIVINPPSGKTYTLPPLSLLEKDRGKPGVGDIKANANIIKRTMQNFGINVEIDEISIGPTLTRYALKPAEGVRLSKIVGLQHNLELALAAHPIRIEAPIPGKSLVGIEVPNSAKAIIGLATLLGGEVFQNSPKPLLVALGRDIAGKPVFADLGRMPHLLIAGATGSGKSVAIHSIVTSLLFRNSPEHLRLIMIDPKRVELTLYRNIPHLLTPVITDAKKTILALRWAAKEMDRRYDVLEAETVRDIDSYHKNILAPSLKKLAKKNESEQKAELPETMPYIVIIIDELADIMSAYPRELESAIVRLAQMSRAVGIHLILSTQRPSVNIITGLIKANIPTRIALQVSSQIDSRTILDTGGAEKLLGAGDLLYLSSEMSKPQRLQSAFISETEVKKLVSYLNSHDEFDLPQEIDLTTDTDGNNISLEGNKAPDEDELYEDARDTIIRAGKASTSYLQRKLRIGYARAARLMDMLEEQGVVGPQEGSRPREVFESYTDTDNDEEKGGL